MTKQEFIKQEWLKFIGIQIYDSLKLSNELSDDGWREVNYLPFDYEKKYDVLKFNKTRFAIRPKSLAGIENNNGWVQIKSSLDLPLEDCNVWVLFTNGQMDSQRYLHEYKNFSTHHYRHVTHYKVIEQPKPPIY